MVTHCPLCRQALRRDETLSRVSTPEGVFLACHACQAEDAGVAPPEPRRYPVGCTMPREPGSDGDLRICGFCRLALYWDDQTTAVRVATEDLHEDGWQEYIRRTSSARATHRQAFVAAHEAFREQTQAHDRRRDDEYGRLALWLEEQLLQALAAAPDQGAYVLREAQLRQEHDQAAQIAELAHAAATAPARSLYDGTLERINFAYRQAAVATYIDLRPLLTRRSDIEPGCYAMCRECRGRYQPRILERLIRLGIAPASLSEEAMPENMLR